MTKQVDIVIGTPCHPNGAFVFDKFLANQREIQVQYPSSELVLSTSIPEYSHELEAKLKASGIKGKVLLHGITKPDYARDRIWDITAGREAIRQYMLSQTTARGLLFLDSDMIFDPAIISRMVTQLQNRDAVYSGYRLKDDWLTISGFGCVIFSRGVLEKLKFRCVEFKNGDVLSEDELLEFDLNRMGSRVNKGIYLSIYHFKNAIESNHLEPRPVPVFNRAVNNKYIRYLLVRISQVLHCNVSYRSKQVLRKLKLG